VEGAARRIEAERTFPPPAHDPCHPAVPPEGNPERPATASTGPQTGAPWQDAGHDPDKKFEQLVEERTVWLRADGQARDNLRAEKAPPPEEIPGPITLTEALDAPDEVVPYRLAGLLPVGARVLLSAQAKTGKTTLIGNLIRSLVDGTPFLGRYPVDLAVTGTVVVIDTEMNRNQLRRWLRDQGIDNTDKVHLITLLGKAHTFDLRVPKLMEHWTAELLRVKAEILIIDPLKPILDSLALSERADTGLVTTPLTALKEAACISELVLAHHAGHNGERARGDSSLRGWPEVEWGLMLDRQEDGVEPDPTGPRFFKAFGRDVQVEESALKYDPDHRRLVFEGGSRAHVKKVAQAVDQEAAVTEVIRANPGIGFNRIRSAVGELGVTIGNDKLKEVLARLRERLVVIMTAKGQSHCYTLNDRPFSSTVPEVSGAVPGPLFRYHVAERSGTDSGTTENQERSVADDDRGPVDE
jgi:hypothetical protein